MDLWGVALENFVYLWKCSTLGCRNMKKNPSLLLLWFPFPTDWLLLLFSLEPQPEPVFGSAVTTEWLTGEPLPAGKHYFPFQSLDKGLCRKEDPSVVLAGCRMSPFLHVGSGAALGMCEVELYSSPTMAWPAQQSISGLCRFWRMMRVVYPTYGHPPPYAQNRAFTPNSTGSCGWAEQWTRTGVQQCSGSSPAIVKWYPTPHCSDKVEGPHGEPTHVNGLAWCLHTTGRLG